MKILHLSDLHLGKKVNDISMLAEQKNVINQALNLIKTQKIEAILIAGDVFDKPVASIFALDIFSNFLQELSILKIPVFIIAGNHDSIDRLSYLSSLLQKCDIFISKPFSSTIEPVSYKDANFYLMPYLYPAVIRKFFPDDEILTYNDAIKKVINSIKLDENKINIILAHQFVIGEDEPILSDSETKSVGSIEAVSYKLFEKFDYVALGHLHCSQKIVLDKIRYGGSILKYSFSEINQNKAFCIVDIDKNTLNISFEPIVPIHQLKHYRGYLREFLDEKFYNLIDKQDYIYFTLLDEDVIDAKKKLSLIYQNIMILDFDNTFTRNLNTLSSASFEKDKTIFEHFGDFYELQMGQKLDEQKEKLVADIINKELL